MRSIRLFPSRRVIFTLASVAVLGSEAAGTEYRGLPIHSYGIENSTMDLYVDNAVLLPRLTHMPLNEHALALILPYPGSEHAQRIAKELQVRSDLSLGHAMPYYYIAVNQALSRIFRNGLFVPRDDDAELGERFGLMLDSNSEMYDNLRELIPITPIRDAHLKVEIFTHEGEFEVAVTELQLHSAKAFWDDTTNRLGFYVDQALFAALPMKARWGDLTSDALVKHVRDYMGRIILEGIGHELVHFVQKHVAMPIYKVPFFAEAGAMFVTDIILFREELTRIGESHIERGLPLTLASESACRVLHDEAPRLGHSGLRRVVRGITRALAEEFDLEAAIMMNDATFYGRDADELRTIYDVGGAFILFAWDLPDSEFARHFSKVIDGRAVGKADLDGLNDKFSAWMRDMASRWWLGPDAEEAHDVIARWVTHCLNTGDYAAAHSGTRAMHALRPSSIDAMLYAGDVFWRLEMPFVALDYYALARARHTSAGLGPSSDPRILSRLGDAYEALGAIPSALKVYSALGLLDGLEELGAGVLIATLRSKLKHHFYSALSQRGIESSQAAFSLMNTYVLELQAGQCLDRESRARLHDAYEALDHNPFLFIAFFTEHFTAVERRMVAEIEEHEVEALLASRAESCQ